MLSLYQEGGRVRTRCVQLVCSWKEKKAFETHDSNPTPSETVEGRRATRAGKAVSENFERVVRELKSGQVVLILLNLVCWRYGFTGGSEVDELVERSKDIVK
jgi:hypothetical protein